jgi:mycoredoxin-dependent peroxiredoxin
MTAEVGENAPDFTLKDQAGNDVTLSSFKGKSAVALHFYPFTFTGV